jgi:hypothetical protein
MRRFVPSLILLLLTTGTAFAATTKTRAKARSKLSERVHFTDTLSLLSKLATNPYALNQGSTPPATVLLGGASNAANDVASLGLGGLGGDSATVGSDAAADAVSDSIKNLFNLPADGVEEIQPVAKPSEAPRVKATVTEPVAKAPAQPLKASVPEPVAKTPQEPVKATVTAPVAKTPPQPVKATVAKPIVKASHEPKETKKVMPPKPTKALPKAAPEPVKTPMVKVEKVSVPTQARASQDVKKEVHTPAKKAAPKLLTESVKVKSALSKSVAAKTFVSQKAAVKHALPKNMPTAKAPVKTVAAPAKHSVAIAKKLPLPRKTEGMMALSRSIPKPLKRIELAKKQSAVRVSKTNAIVKPALHKDAKVVSQAKVEASTRKNSEDSAREKQLEAEVAALQAKLAQTSARKKEAPTEMKPKQLVEARLIEPKKSEEREVAETVAVHAKKVQTTLAPVVAATVAPETKVTVAPETKVAPVVEATATVAPAASAASDEELTMTMVPTSVPAASASVVQASQDTTQTTQLSFFGSIFHWFHSLFFGPDPLPVAAPLPKLQQADPNEGRPQFTRQNVESTASAANNDGLADMAISDEWSRKESEDISLLDQVRREDRALRLDAETPKKPSLPATTIARSGSTHISNFWQQLADEDVEIEAALTENGDDLSEYERLKQLQDSKVTASVEAVNNQLDHSALGRRVNLRKGATAA